MLVAKNLHSQIYSSSCCTLHTIYSYQVYIPSKKNHQNCQIFQPNIFLTIWSRLCQLHQNLLICKKIIAAMGSTVIKKSKLNDPYKKNMKYCYSLEIFPLCWLEYLHFCELGAHGKLHNPKTTTSGRLVG